jgi:hypothetical protein
LQAFCAATQPHNETNAMRVIEKGGTRTMKKGKSPAKKPGAEKAKAAAVVKSPKQAKMAHRPKAQ